LNENDSNNQVLNKAPITKDDFILKGISAFQNQEYFEAHDFFEEAWQEMTGSDKIVWQAIIQLTVSFYHFSSENRKGAVGLAKKASDKLNSLPETFHPQEIARLKRLAVKWKESVNFKETATIPEDIIREMKKFLVPGFLSVQ